VYASKLIKGLKQYATDVDNLMERKTGITSGSDIDTFR